LAVRPDFATKANSSVSGVGGKSLCEDDYDSVTPAHNFFIAWNLFFIERTRRVELKQIRPSGRFFPKEER